MEITYETGTVTGITSGTPGPVGVLLAHGAGVGQDHPWIVAVREGLARHGLFVMSFNYRYTEAGRRAPDRMPTLLAVHRAAANAMAKECDSVILAGKSMGGRVGSHLVGEEGWPAAALVYFGYPLVPMGKGEPRPVDHLLAIDVPQLFFAGSRDRLTPRTQGSQHRIRRCQPAEWEGSTNRGLGAPYTGSGTLGSQRLGQRVGGR